MTRTTPFPKNNVMEDAPGSHDIYFIARRWLCKIALAKDRFHVQLSIAELLEPCVKTLLRITPGAEIVALSLSSHTIYIFPKN